MADIGVPEAQGSGMMKAHKPKYSTDSPNTSFVETDVEFKNRR
jgi:hypothetical protein